MLHETLSPNVPPFVFVFVQIQIFVYVMKITDKKHESLLTKKGNLIEKVM